MVNPKELRSRVKKFFHFSKQEIIGLVPAILVTAFIFSFRDWGGDQLSVSVGLTHLFIMAIITAITFFFRLSFQKIFALSEGYEAEFKVWWAGLIISLVLIFVTLGFVPLVLSGTLVVALRVKQRLGEFRYGFSHKDNAIINFIGIAGNMLLAILFAIGNFFIPETFFFTKGLILNLVMGVTLLLPLPQLEGLNIFFGSRTLYFTAIPLVILNSLLLLSGTKIGLIISIILAALAIIFYTLTGSEK
mgnify:CR=1 FL=1